MAILPGSTLGIIGGGQLGRMFVIAARTMGYEVIVLDPDAQSPAGSMASEHLQSGYTDQQALEYLATHCQVITTEFENIPAESLHYLSQRCPVHPSAEALSITQNRIREKTFIQSLGLLTSPFITIESEHDLARVDKFQFPAILKTATLGYDGKGQVVCQSISEVAPAYRQLQNACILEQRIELVMEISIVLGRNEKGECYCFPIAQNEHVNGILDVSVAPAGITPELENNAQQAAKAIADGLNYCGVLAVEFFISSKGELLVNEIAPRPHNSGHFTLDACSTSQFEQQVRMICGLPAGNCELHAAVAMLNLLGDVWPADGDPCWDEVLKIDKSCLHLYGKKHARQGRKMGHINFLQAKTDQALQSLAVARKILQN
jgi:5-(carboxyamino)imidazole ribonucleotide synthase